MYIYRQTVTPGRTDRSGFGYWARYLDGIIAPAVMQSAPRLLTDPNLVKSFELNYRNRIAVGEELTTAIGPFGEETENVDFVVHNLDRNYDAADGWFGLRKSAPLSGVNGKIIYAYLTVGFKHLTAEGVCPLEHYCTFLEAGEQELLATLGLSLKEGEGRPWMPRVGLKMRFVEPIREGSLEIKTWIGNVGRTSITYRFDLHQDEILKTEAELTMVTLSSDKKSVVEVPTDFRALLKKYT